MDPYFHFWSDPDPYKSDPDPKHWTIYCNILPRRWVESTGQTGTVLTTAELLEEGENGHSWKGVSQDILLKALLVLQKKKKAEVFEDQDGVKFF